MVSGEYASWGHTLRLLFVEGLDLPSEDSLLPFRRSSDDAPQTVVECRQSGLCSLAHGDNDLLVGHVGDISRRIDARNGCATKFIDFDFVSWGHIELIFEGLAVGCKTYLNEHTVDTDAALFVVRSVLDGYRRQLRTVALHLCHL